MGRRLGHNVSHRTWSVVAGLFARPRIGVTILDYTRAVDGGADTDMFCRQIQHLREQARVITLDEAVRGLSREDHAVDNAVVVTFDDGTLDFSDIVLPVLVRFHVPVTLYVSTAHVDDQCRFPWGAAPMTWAGVDEAAASHLVTIGSHSHIHHRLDRVTNAVARDEVQRSIDLLGEHTGHAPLHFAYPEAISGSAQTRTFVDQRFHSVASGRGRVNPVGRTDLHRLARVPVPRRQGAAQFDALMRITTRARV